VNGHDAIDQTEWINQIRTITTIGGSVYYIQKSLDLR
jgi:hypothetical protein